MGANAPTGSIGPSTLNVADAAIAGGDPTMALSVSQSILATDPNNVDALVHAGEAYYALGRCPASEASFQLALKGDPKSAAAQTGIGRCLLKVDPAQAEAAFTAATQDDPGNAAAFNDLGIARDLQGNFAGAASAYQQSLMNNPGSTDTAVNFGLSLALSGQGAEALQYLGPIATGPGATPKIREDYAAALVASGRDDDARQVLSVDMPPDQVNQTLAGFQSLISQAVTNPPPPAAPPPTQPQVDTAPVTAMPMQTSSTPVPLMPAASPPSDPPPVQAPAPVAAAAPPPPIEAPVPVPIPAVAAPVPAPTPQVEDVAPPAAPAVKKAAKLSKSVIKTAYKPVESPPPPVPEAAASAPVSAPIREAQPAPVAPAVEAQPAAPARAPEQVSMPATQSHAAVQIAALNSEEAAHVEWRKVSSAAPTLFAGKSPDISKVQVAGQTYYRLRVSGFANHEDAAQFCTQITSAGGTCMPANF